MTTARRRLFAAAFCGMLMLGGCATPVRPGTGADRPESWSGRLSLRVDSEPAQSFAALFELRGTPERGTLTLTTPIGSTLAQLQWTPGEAWLKNGNETRRYDSVDALIQAATGAAIPVDALFGWLGGRDDTVTGWRPDLTQWSTGKLQAVRESPLPRSDLRIVFERS